VTKALRVKTLRVTEEIYRHERQSKTVKVLTWRRWTLSSQRCFRGVIPARLSDCRVNSLLYTVLGLGSYKPLIQAGMRPMLVQPAELGSTSEELDGRPPSRQRSQIPANAGSEVTWKYVICISSFSSRFVSFPSDLSYSQTVKKLMQNAPGLALMYFS